MIAAGKIGFRILLLAALAVMAACAGQGPGLSGKIRGDRAFEKADYIEAVEEYRNYLESGMGAEDVADAQFMLARSYYEIKDYPSAALEFELFTRHYPRADSLEAAAYYGALCWYQQSPRYDRDSSPTVRAIRKLEDYLLDYPEGVHRESGRQYLRELYDKMARKTISIARFYRRLGRMEAAEIYYMKLLEEQPESDFVGEALEEMAEVQRERGLEEKSEETLRALRAWRDDRAGRSP